MKYYTTTTEFNCGIDLLMPTTQLTVEGVAQRAPNTVGLVVVCRACWSYAKWVEYVSIASMSAFALAIGMPGYMP
jgi:hypothetical protein